MQNGLTNEQRLRNALQLILDHVDYHIQHSCSPADCVVAALPHDVLETVHKVMKETRNERGNESGTVRRNGESNARN